MSTSPERGLRILHLSDTHLFGDGTLHYGIVDTHAALRRVLERAAPLGTIDVVVASGDLSDDGSESSYRNLRALIDPWAAERDAVVVYTMGNHDGRDGFEAVLGARDDVREIGGFRILNIDSSIPGSAYGRIDPEQLDWLREQLREPAPNGTIVAVHHAPVPAVTPLLTALELENPAELLAVCAAADVRIILSGHYHHSLATEAAGIPIIVAPGTANTSDVLAPVGTERATIGAGFAIVEVPVTGSPRAMFVAAHGPEDGTEIFDLDAEGIAQITEAAGHKQ